MTPETEIKLMLVLDDIRYNGSSRTAACRKAGMSPATLYNYMKSDPEFATQLDEAEEERADGLEDAAYERAVKGVVTKRSKSQGDREWEVEEVKYSDPLLIRLLEAARPDKYARRSKSELTGAEGGPLELDETATVSRLASLFEAAKARKAEDKDG